MIFFSPQVFESDYFIFTAVGICIGATSVGVLITMFISILLHKWKVNKITTAQQQEAQPQYEEIMFQNNDAYKKY